MAAAAAPAPALAPPTATATAIVAGDHAAVGASGKPETVVALRHHHTKHFLLASEDGKVHTHPEFNNARHRHHSGRHNGHWHLEHHGNGKHRLRSAHGHVLHINPDATGTAAIHTAPHHLATDNAVLALIADAEGKKHHLQGPNGTYLAVSGEPPEPVVATAQGPATGIEVLPPAVAAQS